MVNDGGMSLRKTTTLARIGTASFFVFLLMLMISPKAVKQKRYSG
jgi:hypothetical protein